MTQGQYLIDELCRLSGFPRRTVRYYVQEGLVDPPAARGRGGFYSDVQRRQLARIKELQEQGYRLEAIRGLLTGAQKLREQETEGKGRAPFAEIERPEVSSPAGQVLSRQVLPGAEAPPEAWTRFAVGPGVELHVSAETRQRLGPAVAAALYALRSIIQKEGGWNE